MRQEVTAASGRGEEAFRWVQEVESKKSGFDDFAESGAGFDSLDAKLASCLAKLTHGELGRRITLKMETAAKSGQMIRGRQILWMVYQHFRLNQSYGSLYQVSDLMAVRMKGDSLESFVNTWDSVIAGMHKEPEPEIVENLFYQQIKGHAALREDIAHYDRSPEEHPDHTYDFLRLCVARYLDRKRQDANREAHQQAFGGATPAAALAAAEDKPDKKKNGKGKGTSKSRSASKGKGRGGKRPCYAFQRGDCAKGKNCEYSHAARRPSTSSSSGKGSTSPRGKTGEKPPC